MFLKLKTKIRRLLSNVFTFHRPASFPFISGDGFRSTANFIYDQFLDFNPLETSYGDVVFVRTNYLKDFFSNIHPFIKEPYVLLSSNEDSTVDSSFVQYIDNKILHWYAENLNFKHEKASVLPIGIQNFVVGKEENFINSFPVFKKNIQTAERKNRILFGFTISNEERKKADETLSTSAIADRVTLSRIDYYQTLVTYKFIASPRGVGLDCHRTWEALYSRVIPILIRNSFSEQLLEQGFPVLIIDDWAEIKTLTEEKLSIFYEEHKDLFDTAKLYLPYWQETFANYRVK